MNDGTTIEELEAEMAGIAIAFESQVWESAGHEHPLEFAEWQAAFQAALENPGEARLVDASRRQLGRLLFD